MHIKFLEIANFRKLLSVRIDLSEETTLFVGANNSGKTSAINALRKFLTNKSRSFNTHDITLSHWAGINKIGDEWLKSRADYSLDNLDVKIWNSLFPMLDIWFHIEQSEIHYVSSIIPTLDWEGGELGLRLSLAPKELSTLYKDFLTATDSAEAVRAALPEVKKSTNSKDMNSHLTIWPSNLVDFLDRKFAKYFEINAYTLNPDEISAPTHGQAKLQELPIDAVPIEGEPLRGLIRIDDIPAQRGFGTGQPTDLEDGELVRSGARQLSEQLRSYYLKHLDPSESPDPSDVEALQAIENAQTVFNKKLEQSFKDAFNEVESMGYPGTTDPKMHISTRLKAIDGLNHSAAVAFEVDIVDEVETVKQLLHLPEDSNGLGYQNLISMIFKLMSFRDAWMRVGKAAKTTDTPHIEPLHLVLVEEPEAHLHAQVQQVFIKKAYEILRDHSYLRENKALRTQLIVSTHSSHVAHEIKFSCLRYFRRLPAGIIARIPVSTVVNLSKTFGSEKETERFVTRYLRAHHADLFFADAIILVEGAAEKMLIPNFIRTHHDFLHQCYISILEISGSHAHRLRHLIEELHLVTLIITDLDSAEGSGRKAVQPAPNQGLVTRNTTLKNWIPTLSSVDELYGATPEKKTIKEDTLFEIRVAYQTPISVVVPKTKNPENAYPYTFEDALAFENLDYFSKLQGKGLAEKFKKAITQGGSAQEIASDLFDALREGKKAELALDILDTDEFNKLKVPAYIQEGLAWLERQIKKKQTEAMSAVSNMDKPR